MKRMLLAAVALTSATAARADDRTPLEQTLDKITYQAYSNPGFATKDAHTLGDMKGIVTPKECYDAVAGTADDAKVHTSSTSAFADLKKDDTGTYATGAAVKAFCKTYERAYVHMAAESAITAAWLARDAIKRPVEGMYESEAQTVGRYGAECAKRVDEALALGFAASEPIESKFQHMPPVALGDAKATICQPAIDWASQRTGDIQGAAKAKQDAIVAVYKKAGIKGKRLELFVSYGLPEDTGFFAAGCESYVTSVKALKSAKKLFVWLEGDQGYTIRTFTFHGDDYTVTEHTYDTQAQAYRGCH